MVATLIGLATFMGNNLVFSILREFLVTYTCYPSMQEIFQNSKWSHSWLQVLLRDPFIPIIQGL